MSEYAGYIKLSRNMLKWRWMSTPNTAYIFILLLLKANYKDAEFQNIKISRGQVVTSIQSLSKSSGLTCSQVRTALVHLNSTGEIASKSYNKFRVITILKYSEYQDIASKDTGKSQANRKQIASRSQQEKERIRKQERKNKKGRSATDAPSGRNGLPKGRDDGTVDDIPEMYQDQFDSYAEYWDWRNQ